MLAGTSFCRLLSRPERHPRLAFPGCRAPSRPRIPTETAGAQAGRTPIVRRARRTAKPDPWMRNPFVPDARGPGLADPGSLRAPKWPTEVRLSGIRSFATYRRRSRRSWFAPRTEGAHRGPVGHDWRTGPPKGVESGTNSERARAADCRVAGTSSGMIVSRTTTLPHCGSGAGDARRSAPRHVTPAAGRRPPTGSGTCRQSDPHAHPRNRKAAGRAPRSPPRRRGRRISS